MKRTDDQSLFTWEAPEHSDLSGEAYHGLLAHSPAHFHAWRPEVQWRSNSNQPATFTCRGIELTLPLSPYGHGTGLYRAGFESGGEDTYYAIFESNLLSAYTRLGKSILVHYISKILLGSNSAQLCSA